MTILRPPVAQELDGPALLEQDRALIKQHD
jgi:hypothetical protein